MSTSSGIVDQHPRERKTMKMRRLMAAALIGAAVIGGAGTGAGSYALWSKQASVPGATIQNGTLAITKTDQPSDTQQCGIGELPSLTVPLKSTQTVNLHTDLTTTLAGDNMAADVNVVWKNAPSLPKYTTATYTITNDAGDIIGSGDLGSPAVINDVPVTAGTVYHVTVSITRVPGIDLSPADTNFADMGSIAFDLVQKRTGAGFN